MQSYSQYRVLLDQILEQCQWGRRAMDQSLLTPHINGSAASHLRMLVSRKKLRAAGAFFTGETLGKNLVSRVPQMISPTPGYDPTCGAGDLLLRWSVRLPIHQNLKTTLSEWGDLIYGTDLHHEFVAVAKRRLAIAAISRGSRMIRGEMTDIDSFFPNITQCCILKNPTRPPDEAVILLNPPFTKIKTPPDCLSWSSGMVSLAAVIYLRSLKSAKNGQPITAILPDVLRSGTRYAKWRSEVEKLLTVSSLEIVGKFNKHTDIDVFTITGNRSEQPASSPSWSTDERSEVEKLSSIANITVGSVVVHRLPDKGKLISYLNVAKSPQWGEVKQVKGKIYFNGTTIRGPMVVVRRTSSPSDKTRAIATLISTNQEVAVDNHLINILPHDRKLETCHKIINILSDSSTQEWINTRIRCRHLTVGSIKEIPISKS